MVNERQAIRWGRPSQLFQRIGGVAGFVRWFGAFQRQRRRVRGSWRRWVAAVLVELQQVAFGRGCIVIRGWRSTSKWGWLWFEAPGLGNRSPHVRTVASVGRSAVRLGEGYVQLEGVVGIRSPIV